MLFVLKVIFIIKLHGLIKFPIPNCLFLSLFASVLVIQILVVPTSVTFLRVI